MVFLRKFYDIAATDTAAPITEEKVDMQPKMNIAEVMAKHGVKNDSAEMVATPIDIKEQKAESKTEEGSKPVDTTTSTVKVEEEAKAEMPKVEKAEVTQQPKVAEQPKTQTWQEVIKTQPNEVLKELGFDENVLSLSKEIKDNPKMAAFFNHWKEKGEVTDYLKELSTDYSKMDAKDVMRHQLKQEYPKASEKQLDILFKEEVINKFKLDQDKFDEDEVAEGMELLEVKAEKYRESLIQNQEKFLLPKYEPKTEEPDNTEQLRQQGIEKYKTAFNDNPLVKSLTESKQMVVGDGDDKFTYKVDNPIPLINVLTDDEAWSNGLLLEVDNNGEKQYVPDVKKQLLIAAIHNDPDGFVRQLIKYGKSLGGKSAIDPIENAKPTDTSTSSVAEAAPKTPAEAMARMGRINSGGYANH